MAARNRRFLQSLVIVAGVLSELLPAEAGSDASVCESQMAKAAKTHAVPLGVLYAIGMTETGKKGSLQPYALNIEGRTVFTDSAEEALA